MFYYLYKHPLTTTMETKLGNPWANPTTRHFRRQTQESSQLASSKEACSLEKGALNSKVWISFNTTYLGSSNMASVVRLRRFSG